MPKWLMYKNRRLWFSQFSQPSFIKFSVALDINLQTFVFSFENTKIPQQEVYWSKILQTKMDKAQTKLNIFHFTLRAHAIFLQIQINKDASYVFHE